ncbi:class I SAM-dependent methyltransferase [Actinoplanes sp. TFC3]|uniref:class I SAM-dependent methyltransferase n=1 Tax=Actinoplanes sp. TFC3 TaxID=1710355 RepID=UPI000833FF0C|nr:methyltransferase domain-containing protein [Actinoplanes sp. TFC3]
MTGTADAQMIKDQQRTLWDAISPGWTSSMEVFERGATALTGELLRLAGVRRGQRVLDIATGLGEPALSAARRVAPDGHVVATDISAAMLEAARRRCAGSGIDFRAADVETPDLPERSFDVVLSRFGLMFAVDPVAALRAANRSLVPGGVLAAAVWSRPASVPMMSLGYASVAERLALPAPAPGTPGPYSLADPAVLTGHLEQAGFGDIGVYEFIVPFRLRDADEYVRFTRDTLPPAVAEAVARTFGTDDSALWAAVRAAAQRHATRDNGYLALPSTALCLRGVRPE